MLTKTTLRKPARLHFEDDLVVVTPADQDRFLLSAQKAIEACKELVQRDEWMSRFKRDLLQPLRHWCDKNEHRIAACYLAEASSAHLSAFVVAAAEAYDFDLAADLALLDLQFGDRGWSLTLHQIPKNEEDMLNAFFDPERALQIYG